MFADRIRNFSSSGIRKVFDLALKMKNPVNLSIGQPDFETPEPLKAAAIEAIQKGYNRYTVTQGIEPLRDRVRLELAKTRNYHPESILITSGTSGGIFLLLLVLINPGDEVLLPDPYFVMYRQLVNLVGGVPKFYNLYPDFQLKPESIEPLITEKTKLLIMNSPSNPTGVVFPAQTLMKVAEIAEKHHLLVVSDEIYDAFVYDEPYASLATYYPKTILVGGFSKTYGVTGWRMGYAAGPVEILEKMTMLQQFSFICASTPAQYGCLKAFDVDMTPQIQDYKRKRDIMYQGLTQLGYEVVNPGGSFYIFPKAPNGNSTKFCEEAIKQELLIIPGETFSEQATHFRISFAATDQTLHRGLEIFAKLKKSLG